MGDRTDLPAEPLVDGQFEVRPPAGIRLVSSDLDGTMLFEHRTITARTVEALHACREAGIAVVPNTGRQHLRLGDLLADAGGPVGLAVTNNGAVGVDLASGEVLFEELIDPDAQALLADRLTTALPDARFWALRSGAVESVMQHGYRDQMSEQEILFGGPLGDSLPLPEVLSQPAIKLIIRHPHLPPHALLGEIQALELDGFHATTSGAPFVEVQGMGVTKATGIARLAGSLGVSASEVLAIGDELNDIEMIRWAGFGVAMGNALPQVKAAADAVTAPDSADGLALVLEALVAVTGFTAS